MGFSEKNVKRPLKEGEGIKETRRSAANNNFVCDGNPARSRKALVVWRATRERTTALALIFLPFGHSQGRGLYTSI